MKKETLIYQFSVVLLSLAGAYFVTFEIALKTGWVELLSGWVLAYLNHLAGWAIKNAGMKKEASAAIRYLSTLNFLRFLVLLLLVLAAVTIIPNSHETFIYALLISYIIFMTGDLIRFYKLFNQNT